MPLSAMRQRFVDAYLGEARFNASKAARLAGYRCPGSQGFDLLRFPEIKAAIEERISEYAMGAEEVLSRLAEQARAEQTQYLAPEGLDAAALLAAGKGHLIKGVKRTDKIAGGGESVTTINYEFHDAQQALITLGRYHSLWKDVSVRSLTDVELIAEAKRLFAGAVEAGPDSDAAADEPSVPPLRS